MRGRVETVVELPSYTRGLALAGPMGRGAAHEHVRDAGKIAVKENRHLRDVAKSDPEISKHLSAKEIDRLFDPDEYLGVADQLIDRVLEGYASRTPKSPLSPFVWS